MGAPSLSSIFRFTGHVATRYRPVCVADDVTGAYAAGTSSSRVQGRLSHSRPLRVAVRLIRSSGSRGHQRPIPTGGSCRQGSCTGALDLIHVHERRVASYECAARIKQLPPNRFVGKYSRRICDEILVLSHIVGNVVLPNANEAIVIELPVGVPVSLTRWAITGPWA